MKTITGTEAKAKRIKLGLNQTEFWGRLGITQSGASRYESGRSIPRPVQVLYVIAYGTEKQAEAAVERLRNP
jgi:transcriptional regulator with XRE-family HTH domain